LDADGVVSDWTASGVSVTYVDDAESDDGEEFGIKAQWDILNVWAANDGLRQYLRVDTKNSLDFSHQEFIRVCFDLPEVSGGSAVEGCEGINTDVLVFVRANPDDDSDLKAWLIDCNLAENNCDRPPELNTHRTITAAYDGESVEISFFLGDAGITTGDAIDTIVYFDNNDLPADDQAEFQIHPDICVLHPCGWFNLVRYAGEDDLAVVGSVSIRRDKFPATSWLFSFYSSYLVKDVQIQFADELADFPTSDDGTKLVPSLFSTSSTVYTTPEDDPNVVVADASDWPLISIHATLINPRTEQTFSVWAHGVEWRDGCPCHPGFIAFTECEGDK
jgi:hypothetical protein